MHPDYLMIMESLLLMNHNFCYSNMKSNTNNNMDALAVGIGI